MAANKNIIVTQKMHAIGGLAARFTFIPSGQTAAATPVAALNEEIKRFISSVNDVNFHFFSISESFSFVSCARVF